MTEETLICGAFIRKSAIGASVKPFTANFAAELAVCGISEPTDAQKPLMLLASTRCASPVARNSGKKALVVK